MLQWLPSISTIRGNQRGDVRPCRFLCVHQISARACMYRCTTPCAVRAAHAAFARNRCLYRSISFCDLYTHAACRTPESCFNKSTHCITGRTHRLSITVNNRCGVPHGNASCTVTPLLTSTTVLVVTRLLPAVLEPAAFCLHASCAEHRNRAEQGLRLSFSRGGGSCLITSTRV